MFFKYSDFFSTNWVLLLDICIVNLTNSRTKLLNMHTKQESGTLAVALNVPKKILIMKKGLYIFSVYINHNFFFKFSGFYFNKLSYTFRYMHCKFD